MHLRLFFSDNIARIRRAVCRHRWQREYERSLNDRADVEQQLFDVARGKDPIPSLAQFRKWATKLGVPAHWRDDAEQRALRELIDAAQEVCDAGALIMMAAGVGRIREAMKAYRSECGR